MSDRAEQMHEVTIRSTTWIYTPGFFNYLQAMYQTEAAHAITLLVELTNQTLTDDGAEAALNGDLSVEILTDSVCIHTPAKYINAAALPA